MTTAVSLSVTQAPAAQPGFIKTMAQCNSGFEVGVEMMPS